MFAFLLGLGFAVVGGVVSGLIEMGAKAVL
jgi:hypothetical protein